MRRRAEVEELVGSVTGVEFCASAVDPSWYRALSTPRTPCSDAAKNAETTEGVEADGRASEAQAPSGEDCDVEGVGEEAECELEQWLRRQKPSSRRRHRRRRR